MKCRSVPNDELIFRSLAENNALVRIKQDGTGREPIASPPVFDKFGVSPDGQWVIVFSPGAGQALAATLAVPTHGGAPRRICRQGACFATWSSDGRFFYVLNYLTDSPSAGRAHSRQDTRDSGAARQVVARSPAGGIDLTAPQVAIPGARVIDHDRHLTRTGSVDVRVHEDRSAAQSLSSPVALKESLRQPSQPTPCRVLPVRQSQHCSGCCHPRPPRKRRSRGHRPRSRWSRPSLMGA